MSVVVCEECERYIDSDFDADCFDMHGMALCENCRERLYNDEQERMMSEGPGPSLLDQQIAAMKFK